MHGSVTQTPILTLPIDEFTAAQQKSWQLLQWHVTRQARGLCPARVSPRIKETKTNGIYAAKVDYGKDKNPEVR